MLQAVSTNPPGGEWDWSCIPRLVDAGKCGNDAVHARDFEQPRDAGPNHDARRGPPLSRPRAVQEEQLGEGA